MVDSAWMTRLGQWASMLPGAAMRSGDEIRPQPVDADLPGIRTHVHQPAPAVHVVRPHDHEGSVHTVHTMMMVMMK